MYLFLVLYDPVSQVPVLARQWWTGANRGSSQGRGGNGDQQEEVVNKEER